MQRQRLHSQGGVGRLIWPPLLVALAVHLLSIIICSNAFIAPSSSLVGHRQQHRCPHPQSTTTTSHCLSVNEPNVDNDIVPTIRQRRQQQQQQRQHCHYNLTILIPAYNEINRIGDTLCKYINYMKHQPVYQHQHDDDTTTTTTTTGQCSILVVDDGSTDGTCQYIQEKRQNWLVMAVPSNNHDDDDENFNYWKINDDISCISLPTNRGKGAAIARGMMELHHTCYNGDCFNTPRCSKNDVVVTSLVLVADADGSGDISCLDDMIHSLECLLSLSSTATGTAGIPSSSKTPMMMSDGNNLGIIVGKRQYSQSKKSLLRSILSWGFRTCVSILFIGTNNNNNNNSYSKNNNNSNLGVSDTQCGFKLMTTRTGQILYHNLHLQQWSHDVEVLYRANCLLGIPVGDCDVNWVDKDGSKLVRSGKDAVVMSLVMLGEIGWMRLMYGMGRWNMDTLVQERKSVSE